ncbi:MAG: hydroxyethylthiazole kinase [Gordonibacter sp.]|uniref:hydroxyethylthiazole kinase n=1 Tax=Gordonibacter sp. TaxID=1968902 RepID=UPI002FC62F92
MIDKAEIKKQLVQAAEEVRRTTPMAGSITNAATMSFVANAQIAAGGSAAMVYLAEEAEFLAQAGGAFYVNMGTLLPVHEESIPHVARILSDADKPWVLDPVGIGIGSLRTAVLHQLKAYKPSIIRGNASEVIALAGLWELEGGGDASRVRGVDSTDAVDAARQAALSLAAWTGGAVAVSGETDLVVCDQMVISSRGGSPLMEKITGSGCSLGGVAAVYATSASPFIAALAATNVYNVAGRRASQRTTAPGSFQVAFLDELYTATPQDIANNPFEVLEA